MSLLTESEVSTATARTSDEAPTIVRLEDVTVEYHAPRERITTLKEYTIRLLQRRVRHEEFKALRNVSLEIRQGEVFGIIGHNGAGKSTLLKVVSRVMRPTRGRVWVKGRVAPLLELGAGFHPELSGRENVMLNGTLLGYKQAEIKALFDSIVDFAELWDFIDAPLRTYSTGMAVRLGFAVATATRPDILIVDEVLSVGDERFQEKCAARMAEFRKGGTSILLVTHASALVQKLCDRAAWLDHGEVRAVGQPKMVIDHYHCAYKSVTGNVLPTDLPAQTATVRAEVKELSPLEELALQKTWFYRFDLPSGVETPCSLPPVVARYHSDRLAMMNSVLEPLFSRRWPTVSCLDLGCNQGFFSLKLAERGCEKVLGLDARPENIEEAQLIQQIYAYPNLSFGLADVTQLQPDEMGQFDVVLMFSMLFLLENPLGVLRLVRSLTKRVLLLETPVAPEVSGQIDWGSYQAQKPLQGSFALIDQSEEINVPVCSLTGLSLCPGRETLLWLLKRLGFTRVEVVVPPPDAYDQLATGKRIMIAAYV